MRNQPIAATCLLLVLASCTGSPEPDKRDNSSPSETGGYEINTNAFQMGGRNDFPASITDGHLRGSFIRWLTANEAEHLSAPVLYERYKDTPSTDAGNGLTPYLLGAISGQPCYSDGRGSFRITDWSIRTDVLFIDVEFTNVINPMTSYAGGYGYFAIRVDGLRPRVSTVQVKVTEQWAYEMGEEGDPADFRQPAKERLLEDFSVDLEAAFAAEENYTTDMTEMPDRAESYPESNVSWRWQTAKNWRGVELLHGKLLYELDGRVQDSWTFRRGKLGGLTEESCSWSYRTDTDNWEYCEIGEAGRYVEGLRHGEWVGTYRDGSGAYHRTYSGGQIVSGTSWYPDGRKLGEVTSDADVVTSRSYGPGGDLTDEVSYVGSSKHGFQRMWWDNGQIREERQYDTGRPVGLWRRWDRDGNLIQEDKDPKPGFPPKSG